MVSPTRSQDTRTNEHIRTNDFALRTRGFHSNQCGAWRRTCERSAGQMLCYYLFPKRTSCNSLRTGPVGRSMDDIGCILFLANCFFVH